MKSLMAEAQAMSVPCCSLELTEANTTDGAPHEGDGESIDLCAAHRQEAVLWANNKKAACQGRCAKA